MNQLEYCFFVFSDSCCTQVLRYTLTIFTSAFLLFLIQPLAAKLLLPVTGGTSTVWTTCIMYFQVVLLLGYLYAHLIRSWFSPRAGCLIHGLLIATAWFALQFDPLSNNPESTVSLAAVISRNLTLSIGLPFLLLSATGPLIQAWHTVSHPNQQTYRLYALSNAGSLLALISYPFIFDQFIKLSNQENAWTVGFALFCLLMGLSGLQVFSQTSWPEDTTVESVAVNKEKSSFWKVTCVWVLLASTASTLLLATTNILCQEVASFPFLWILPLVFYLLSLIICFDRPAWYRRRIFQPMLVASVFAAIVILHLGTKAGLVIQATGCAAVVFAGAMVCHGELNRLKPESLYLTKYYLAIALGGAIGGLFSTVIAPRVFTVYFEFHLALAGCLLIPSCIVLVTFIKSNSSNKSEVYSYLFMSTAAFAPLACSLVYYLDPGFQSDLISRMRNEYGIVSVRQADGYRSMYSGNTNHGGQYLDDNRSLEASTYYSKGSGAEIAFSTVRKWKANPDDTEGLHVGVVGLGTGSLMSHSQFKDRFRFYEINPQVVGIARKHFTFLSHGEAEVVVGDGRVQLQRELDANGSHKFDLIFLDAFSSDSIPAHLLTSECFDLYLQHLDNHGIIVAHITNRFVDLRPVIKTIADSKKTGAVLIDHSQDGVVSVNTRWVLLSRNPELLIEPEIEDCRSNWPEEMPMISWSDEHTSLAPTVNWSSSISWNSRKED